MQSERDGLVPIGDALAGMGGPVKAIREASPQAHYHFTQADQVTQLVSASEADPSRSSCTHREKTKLPFGNFPRLILAWVSTEAVRTQSGPTRARGGTARLNSARSSSTRSSAIRCRWT